MGSGPVPLAANLTPDEVGHWMLEGRFNSWDKNTHNHPLELVSPTSQLPSYDAEQQLT